MASPTAAPSAGLARPLALAAAVSTVAYGGLLLLTLLGVGSASATAAPATAPVPPCSLCNGAPYRPPPGVTVPFNTAYETGSDDVPLDDPRLARPADLPPSAPDQIALTLGAGGAVIAHWATGEARVVDGNRADGRPPPKAAGAAVQHGPAPDTLTSTDVEKSAPTRYSQRYKQASYHSPDFHHVPLTGLVPGERRYYRVGSEKGGWSDVRSFVAPPTVDAAAADDGSPLFPYRLGVVGDTGQTHNTTSTLEHLAESAPAAILHVGDYSYADMYGPVGQVDLSPSTTYQVRWDTFQRLLSPVVSAAPMITVVGNHERERDVEGHKWQSVTARYAPPGGDRLYFSTDAGPIHVVVINTYTDDVPAMKSWLEADLKAVNRTRTPWVVAAMHAPWYTTYLAHYREAECLRVAIEPVLAAGGVDLVLAGHVHAYERATHVLKHAPSLCGPPHICIGDGGNAERMYLFYVDADAGPTTTQNARDGGCPTGAHSAGDKCATSAPGPYCSVGQAPWSAYREPSFGFGVLKVLSPTRAEWTWHRNQDGVRVAADRVTLTRGAALCSAAAPAPAGGPA